jgi:hypothetical protein
MDRFLRDQRHFQYAAGLYAPQKKTPSQIRTCNKNKRNEVQELYCPTKTVKAIKELYTPCYH